MLPLYFLYGGTVPEDAILYYDADEDPGVELTGGPSTFNSSILGPQYQRLADGSYINVGAQPAVDTFDGEKWLRSCGAVTNLFPGDPTIARSVTLTAQSYTLQIFGSGSVSCSYGTATVGTPLTFTATAGTTTFTPSGAGLWMLTATAYPVPYVPPGVTQPASNATATNGTWFSNPLDSELWKALTGSPLTLATRIRMGVGSGDISVNGTFRSVISCGLYASLSTQSFGRSGDGTPRLSTGSDGSSFTHAISSIWNRDIVVRRFTQVNAAGNRYRVGVMIEGVQTEPQWSSPSDDSNTWTAYDGSFNPSTLYRLMFGYNNPYPMWLNKLTVWKRQVPDAELLEAMA